MSYWRTAKLLILTTTQTNFQSCRLLPPLFPTSLATGQTCCKHAPEFPSRTPSIRARRTPHGSPIIERGKKFSWFEKKKYLFRFFRRKNKIHWIRSVNWKECFLKLSRNFECFLKVYRYIYTLFLFEYLIAFLIAQDHISNCISK